MPRHPLTPLELARNRLRKNAKGQGHVLPPFVKRGDSYHALCSVCGATGSTTIVAVQGGLSNLCTSRAPTVEEVVNIHGKDETAARRAWAKEFLSPGAVVLINHDCSAGASLCQEGRCWENVSIADNTIVNRHHITYPGILFISRIPTTRISFNRQ